MKNTLTKLCFTLFLFSSSLSFGQTFEGWINYKLEVLNPNPDMIPDSVWTEQIKSILGEKGYMTQKYYYKNNDYSSVMNTNGDLAYQTYNPKDKLIYSWQQGSDSAVTFDSREYFDKLVKIEENDDEETILGIPCKSITLISNMGKMKLWYNSDYLKMNPTLFKDHKYGHWDEILKKTGSATLKMDLTMMMTHMVQTAIEYKEETVDDSHFDIPKFKTIIESPIN